LRLPSIPTNRRQWTDRVRDEPGSSPFRSRSATTRGGHRRPTVQRTRLCQTAGSLEHRHQHSRPTDAVAYHSAGSLGSRGRREAKFGLGERSDGELVDQSHELVGGIQREGVLGWFDDGGERDKALMPSIEVLADRPWIVRVVVCSEFGQNFPGLEYVCSVDG